MGDRRSGTADWVVPAILVGVGVGLLLMFGLVYFLTDSGRAEPEGIAEELDVYTRCLNDHGANVPRVVALRDGGFSVTVPGSMLDDGFDGPAFAEARDDCRDVAPDLFGGLLGSLTGSLIGGSPLGFLGDGFDGIFEEFVYTP